MNSIFSLVYFRNKKPKRRPNRPKKQNNKNPAILKPVQNTKKRQIKPKPVQKAPEPVAKTPALTSVQEAAQVETPELKVPQQVSQSKYSAGQLRQDASK